MAGSDDITTQVVRRLVEASDRDLEEGAVTLASSLRDDLDLTSLQAVSLVLDLEDDFGIVVEDEELAALGTVGDLVDLIRAKREPDSAVS